MDKKDWLREEIVRLDMEINSLSPYPDTPMQYLVERPIKKLVDGEIVETTIEYIDDNSYQKLQDYGRLQTLHAIRARYQKELDQEVGITSEDKN